MLFNSISFIFAFLPVVLAGYYALALSPLAYLRRPFLILATLAFYGLAGPQFLPLLAGSVALNFLAGKVIARLENRGRAKAWLVALAVIANVALLGYFKYFTFLAEAIGGLVGTDFRIEQIILPLGISFFTFQQIGYLVDVGRGRIKAAGALDFGSFVLFFPQLLAGPIVQYAEVIEQHRRKLVWGEVGRNILIGLAIFAIGLFKKTVIADTLALYAQPVFAAAREGEVIGFLDTWLAAFAYTAQVYFDFSGYSDMAIGTARMFGVILPINFLSPLRSKSVVEIWRRWHITLGRWVQLYIFQPVAVPCARLAAQAGLGKYGTLTLAVVVPTMLAMLVIGIWHGAGWTFVVFGLMQGVYMSVNEVWAAMRKKARKAQRKASGGPPVWRDPAARVATLLAFVFAILPFGAQGPADMSVLFAAAIGGSEWLIVQADWPFGLEAAILFTALAYLIVFLLPNSHEIMGRFEPVLDWRDDWSARAKSPVHIQWKVTLGWALVTALALFFAVAFIMRGTTEFIYFNF